MQWRLDLDGLTGSYRSLTTLKSDFDVVILTSRTRIQLGIASLYPNTLMSIAFLSFPTPFSKQSVFTQFSSK